MKKFITCVITLTAFGLIVVYGEVEAMKIGYDIRQLNIRKRELTHRMKSSEFEIASLTAPDYLEARMAADHVHLVNPTFLRIAKVSRPIKIQGEQESSFRNRLLSRLFVTSAQADSTQQ